MQVCERTVGCGGGEAAALLGLVAPRVDHLHARIGTPQRPQVTGNCARDGRGAVQLRRASGFATKN